MNDLLIKNLLSLAKEYRNNPRTATDKYRAVAYEKAVQVLSGLTYQVTLENVDKIPNIGPKTLLKIKEMLTTGKLSKLEKVIELKKDPVQILKGIIEVGNIAANEWVEMGLDTLEKVMAAHREGRIHLTKAQQFGIKYYDQINSRIMRSEIDDFDQFLQKLARCFNQVTKRQLVVIIAGSYRRGEPDSGDIDIIVADKSGLMTRNAKLLFLKLLHHHGNLFYDITSGDRKYRGIGRTKVGGDVRRIDIEWVDHIKSLPYTLIYFTGPLSKNIVLRGLAKTKGLKLNQEGLFRGDVAIDVGDTEEKIENFLRS